MELRIDPKDLSLAEKLDTLPTEPGVYQFKDGQGTVLYVGKAVSLHSRVRQYFQKSRVSHPRIDRMVSQVRDLEIIVTDSEVEALILESNLIKKFSPRYNVMLKDDKSYPYIVVTNEPFPRVFVTRRVIRDGSRYFGPYTDVTSVRAALKSIRDIFMIRSCNFELTPETIEAKKYKLCLDYHIKKCGGPCEGLVSQADYGAMIEQAAQVLRGNTETVAELLKEEIQRLAGAMRFEEAAVLRDRLRALYVYSEKQKMVDTAGTERDILAAARKGDDGAAVIFKVRGGKVLGKRHFYLTNAEGRSPAELLETVIQRHYAEEEEVPPELVLSDEPEAAAALAEWLGRRRGMPVTLRMPEGGELQQLVSMVRHNAEFLLGELELQRLKRGEKVPHPVEALKRDLRLAAAPRRIECFDNSNTGGTDPVASMVVFIDGKPRKSEYRKFKIQTVEGANDFASMQEVIRRRYGRVMEEQSELPDLIMVDGGKGQLSSAVEALRAIKFPAVPIIGLAKRLEEIFVPGSGEPVVLPRTSSGLKLLQQVRDEAHRFAITFHRELRQKRILSTELDLIKGVGKKRAQELLEAFGSVQGVKFATPEQLAAVVGEATAASIRAYFSGSEAEASPASGQHAE